jgi:hypothetical protein
MLISGLDRRLQRLENAAKGSVAQSTERPAERIRRLGLDAKRCTDAELEDVIRMGAGLLYDPAVAMPDEQFSPYYGKQYRTGRGETPQTTQEGKQP